MTLRRASSRKPKYTYGPHGSRWRVYEMTYNEAGSLGTPVGEFNTREEARRRAYELNRWNYGGKKGAPGKAQERR